MSGFFRRENPNLNRRPDLNPHGNGITVEIKIRITIENTVPGAV
jgi:hypothetical protein